MREHKCECHACKYRRWYYSREGEKPLPDYKRCYCKLCLRNALNAANKRNRALRKEMEAMLLTIEKQRGELRCLKKETLPAV